MVTYNSSAFVLETLESIKAQSYPNIELVVSDDCSKDDTLKICRDWLDKNGDRFSRVELLSTNKNTGVTGNVNRGCKQAIGEWIKLIAGDDVLVKDCINSYINIALKNDINFFFGKQQCFVDNPTIHKGKIYPGSSFIKMFNRMSAKDQFNDLSIANHLSAPTSFIKRDTLVNLDYFDENYPMVEDVPMWLKATLNGEKIYILDKLMVYYRKHEKSLTTGNSATRNSNFGTVRNDLYYKYINDNVSCFIKWHITIRRKIVALKYGNHAFFSKIANLLFLSSPYSYYTMVVGFFAIISKKETKC